MNAFMNHMTRIFAVGLTAIMLLTGGCTKKEAQTATDQYTCPMHPTVQSDKPGACPVCGMELVRKARAGEEVKITEDIARLLQSPDAAVVSSLATLRGEYSRRNISVEAHGVVTFDTRYVYEVPARVGGRLESVYVHYALQAVKQGQKLFEIYSPELVTAQDELLYLASHDPGNTDLMKAAREKLYLLGVAAAQVDDLLKAGKTTARFTIFSPYSGYAMPGQSGEAVVAAAPSSSAPSAMKVMGAAGGTTAVSTGTSKSSMLHEGDYVSRGQRLMTVVSLNAVRVELKMPSASGAAIRVGDTLSVALNNAQPRKARVDFVEPFFDQGEEFVNVRVYVRGADLQISQLVEAHITQRTADLFWLPVEAVADLGTEKIVFVKERGLFKPRPVITGARSGGWIEIRKGLASSDDVAANASYLVDSESFIKTK